MTDQEIVRYPDGTEVRLKDGRVGTVVEELPALGRGMVLIRVEGSGDEPHPWTDIEGYA